MSRQGGARVMQLGEVGSFRRTVSNDDVQAFSALTGDTNPVHFASAAGQGRQPLVQGAFMSALAATLIGVHLPGPGSVTVSQSLTYVLPVYPGQTLTVRGTVTHSDPERRRCVVAIEGRNELEELVMEGTMVVAPPRRS
jgi:acyl dehydratase